MIQFCLGTTCWGAGTTLGFPCSACGTGVDLGIPWGSADLVGCFCLHRQEETGGALMTGAHTRAFLGCQTSSGVGSWQCCPGCRGMGTYSGASRGCWVSQLLLRLQWASNWGSSVFISPGDETDPPFWTHSTCGSGEMWGFYGPELPQSGWACFEAGGHHPITGPKHCPFMSPVQCCERITGKCNWRRLSCLVLCWSHSGWCVNRAYRASSVS